MPQLSVPSGPLRSRNFRLLLACDVISAIGTAVATVALPFAVLRIGGSASDVGYVAAAYLVPLIGFLLLGGVVADRLPRHQVMVAANALQALGQAASAALLLTGHALVWDSPPWPPCGASGPASTSRPRKASCRTRCRLTSVRQRTPWTASAVTAARSVVRRWVVSWSAWPALPAGRTMVVAYVMTCRVILLAGRSSWPARAPFPAAGSVSARRCRNH
jgi:MFS family permease